MKIGALDCIKNHHSYKQYQLDAETHKITDNNAERHNQPWKIDLPENTDVVLKHRTGLGKTVCKIIPSGNACQIKKRTWKVIGTDAGQVTKNERIDERRKNRLDEKPK